MLKGQVGRVRACCDPLLLDVKMKKYGAYLRIDRNRRNNEREQKTGINVKGMKHVRDTLVMQNIPEFTQLFH